MTPQDLGREVAQAGLRSTPPVLVSGAIVVHGLTVPDIFQIAVCVATLGFILEQAAYLAWKWRRERRATEATKAAPPAA